MSHSSPACSQATVDHGEPASSGAAAEGTSDFGALPQHQVTIFSHYTPPACQWVVEICFRVSVAQHINGTGLLGAVLFVRFARLPVVRVFCGGKGGSDTCPPGGRAGSSQCKDVPDTIFSMFTGLSATLHCLLAAACSSCMWLLRAVPQKPVDRSCLPTHPCLRGCPPPQLSPLPQVCYILGPFRETTLNESIFLCPMCDKKGDYPEFQREIDEQMPADVKVMCCVEWLEGGELVASKVKGIPPHTTAVAWEDPYPGEEGKAPKHKRFFYYKMGALELGIREERRVRHPACLQDHVAHCFPDEVGSPTKVGYVQRD